jgi:hypothetical protein
MRWNRWLTFDRGTAILGSLGDLTTRIAKIAKTDVRISTNFTAAIGSISKYD